MRFDRIEDRLWPLLRRLARQFGKLRRRRRKTCLPGLELRKDDGLRRVRAVRPAELCRPRKIAGDGARRRRNLAG